MGDNVVSGGEAFDWEAAEDITALSEGEFYGRGILQGRMSVIRALLDEGGRT
jgi:hypothetical protein